MTPGNQGQPDAQPPTSPASPDHPGAVWPPPPTLTPDVVLPFKTVFAYAEGSVPLFRVGSLALGEGGVTIQGKVVPRYEIQVPIIAVCFLIRIGWIIAYLIMEYAVRSDAVLGVGWDQVRRVVLVPRKRQVCLVYDAPNYKGVVKTFSLTTRLDPAAYDTYATVARQHAQDRITEGRLRAWTSPVVWTVCVGILVVLVILGIGLALSSRTGTAAGP